MASPMQPLHRRSKRQARRQPQAVRDPGKALGHEEPPHELHERGFPDPDRANDQEGTADPHLTSFISFQKPERVFGATRARRLNLTRRLNLARGPPHPPMPSAEGDGDGPPLLGGPLVLWCQLP